MTKRESKFIVEKKDADGRWAPWDAESYWESTADALRDLRLSVSEDGEYRVIQLRSVVKIAVAKVNKVTLQEVSDDE